MDERQQDEFPVQGTTKVEGERTLCAASGLYFGYRGRYEHCPVCNKVLAPHWRTGKFRRHEPAKAVA